MAVLVVGSVAIGDDGQHWRGTKPLSCEQSLEHRVVIVGGVGDQLIFRGRDRSGTRFRYRVELILDWKLLDGKLGGNCWKVCSLALTL